MRSGDWLLKVIDEASARVEKWPEWKNRGDSDGNAAEDTCEPERENSQIREPKSE
jgi:hypothetical protein